MGGGLCTWVLSDYERIIHKYTGVVTNYALVGGAPEAYGSRRVCLWVSEFVSESFHEIAVRIFSAIAEN